MIYDYDVAIVGAGIVGLAHAWRASQRGLRVLVVERSAFASGASVRNFGMIWPIGQPAGELHEIAMKARALWTELGEKRVVDVIHCGSIHLAHHADEMDVLEEYQAAHRNEVSLLTSNEVLKIATLANPQGLRGGMHSVTEIRVDPRTASHRIANWLTESCGVEFRFNTLIRNVAENFLEAADRRKWSAKKIVVCSGSDLQTLFPQVLAESGLKICKLQMLKSVAQADISPVHPHIASGLTLRHYTSFKQCPSLPKLCHRIAEEKPELDHYGIHVMASPFPTGEVILGDSHEYGEQVTPFDKSEIDELILRELRSVISLKDWTIQERWHGIYAKHPTLPVFEAECLPGVHAFVGTGGAGMTMSFGLAERAWQQWIGR